MAFDSFGLRMVFSAAVAASSLALPAASIDKVLVRQQWPWTTDVKVEYRLQDVSTPVDILVECSDGTATLPQDAVERSIIGKTHALTAEDNGIGFFYIDPVRLFGDEKISVSKFTVRLSLASSDSNVLEPLYKIIDLETKEVTTLTRADFYNDRGAKYGDWVESFAAIGSSPVTDEPYTTSLEDVFIWTGVTNNIAYKTTKLVMRRIPAKNKSFVMGGANDYKNTAADNYSFTVSFTNDYYLAVFETTHKQAQLLQGYAESAATLTDEEAVMPADKIAKIASTASTTYEQIRGLPTQWEGWPENVYAVAPDSALGRIRSVFTGLDFDVPTEAQWEYACRAGTETMYYSGVNPPKSTANYTAEVSALGWHSGNSDNKVHAVGLLKPNAFGLYDMLGNYGELTRDLHDISKSVCTSDGSVSGPAYPTVAEEPSGWMDKDEVLKVEPKKWGSLFRGESYGRNYDRTKSACRRGYYQKLDGTWASYFGVRLFLPAEQD